MKVVRRVRRNMGIWDYLKLETIEYEILDIWCEIKRKIKDTVFVLTTGKTELVLTEMKLP